MYYACASLKQGGLAACQNTARVKRAHVEALILAEVESEILSDEAMEHARKAIRAELRRLAKQQVSEPPPATPRLAKLDAQAEELRSMQKCGKLSAAVAGAALDAIERERSELIASASKSHAKSGAEILRIIPQSAQLYRDAVRNLTGTLTDPAERQQARALIAQLLGGQVMVRQEGEAVYGRLEMDSGVLLAAAGENFNRINDLKRGSGGVL